MRRILFILLLTMALVACHNEPPPHHPNNICSVFREYPSWYWVTQGARRRWGLPISVQMAIIYQESHFRAAAEPAQRKLFGFIPWLRPTTASGYAQALEGTWRRYLHAVGRLSAGRDNFSDAVDFIGWYTHWLRRQLHISAQNAFSLYLAYHEGLGGYRHRTYRHNNKLLAIAHHVSARAKRYRTQLLRCQRTLPQKPWWRFWS